MQILQDFDKLLNLCMHAEPAQDARITLPLQTDILASTGSKCIGEESHRHDAAVPARECEILAHTVTGARAEDAQNTVVYSRRGYNVLGAPALCYFKFAVYSSTPALNGPHCAHCAASRQPLGRPWRGRVGQALQRGQLTLLSADTLVSGCCGVVGFLPLHACRPSLHNYVRGMSTDASCGHFCACHGDMTRCPAA